VGNARTFLIAWLAARQAGARLLLRIEDIDSPRVKAGAADQVLEDLRWLGLDWDGEIEIQSRRMSHYRDALARLRSANLIYPCTCSRSDVERAASAPHAENASPVYPGTCAARSSAEADLPTDRPYCWRFRLPRETPAFVDRCRGPIELDLHQDEGDFVVWKSADAPAYQLAVVVDDALCGITEVIRGDDLIPSTPRQLLLYRALGFVPPRFGHVPLVVGPDGRRLAKRHGDTRLASLRADGFSAESLVGMLAWSCGWIAEPRSIAAAELLPHFRWETIPRQPFVLTSELLLRVRNL
jgi:glutamyl-tRNA synthetase